jgi:hypothetical protein
MSGLPATSQPEQADQLQSQLQHFRIVNTEQRFTIDGSAALEQQLTELCDEVLAGVQKIVPSKLLQMLVLGGGYGRGQGGVLRTEAGDAPFFAAIGLQTRGVSHRSSIRSEKSCRRTRAFMWSSRWIRLPGCAAVQRRCSAMI